SPFGNTARIFTHQPEVSYRHEQMQCIEVGGGDRANGAVAVDEGVPHRHPLAWKEDISPQIDRKVVRQVAGAAVVEIEEDGLSRTEDFCCDARVAAVTIAVAVRPAQ